MSAVPPNSTCARVLIADAAPLTRWALERAFASEGFETCAVPGCEQLLDQLMQLRYNLVVSASRFDDDNAMPILRRIAHARPDIRVIVLGDPGDFGDEPHESPNLVIVEQPFSVADLLRVAGYSGASPAAPL